MHYPRRIFRSRSGLSTVTARRTRNRHSSAYSPAFIRRRSLLHRSWLDSLLLHLLDPAAGYFARESPDGPDSLEISYTSDSLPEAFEYFEFIGTLYSLAVFHGVIVDPRIVPVIYPMLSLASQEVSHCDIKNAIEESLVVVVKYVPRFGFRQHQQILTPTPPRNGPGSCASLLSNVLYDSRTDKPFQAQLVKDGSEFSDAEDGKEFLAALTAYQCAPSRDRQLRALSDGFWSLVKPEALLSFSEAEVKKLIGGISVFDGYETVLPFESDRLTDKSYREFFSDTKASSTSPNELDQQIESFWKLVQSWSIENQRALMRYVTGLQDMPATHRLKILKASDDKIGRLTVLPGDGVDALPPYADKSEHVLFLPSYDSVETMEAQVLKIINNENLVCPLVR